MKINPLQNKAVDSVQKEKIDSQEVKKDFQKHLDSAMDSRKTESIDKGKAIEIPTAYSPFMLNKGEERVRQPVEKLETVLSSLDLYQNALKNPDIKNRQMEGLLKEINGQKEDLITMMNDLPDNDNLKAIIKDMAIVIIDETNRYYRSLSL